jgi:hypothetical protein
MADISIEKIRRIDESDVRPEVEDVKVEEAAGLKSYAVRFALIEPQPNNMLYLLTSV